MVAGVITFHDITERQALAESLREARNGLERRVRAHCRVDAGQRPSATTCRAA